MFFPLLWYPEELYYSSIDEPDVEDSFEEFDSSVYIEDDIPYQSLLDEPDVEDSTDEVDPVSSYIDNEILYVVLLDEPETEEDYLSEDTIFPSFVEDDYISVFSEDVAFEETSEEDVVEAIAIDSYQAADQQDELIVVLLDEIDFEDEDEDLLIEPISDYTIIIVSTDEELFQPALDEDWNEEDPDESFFDFQDYEVQEEELVTGGRQIWLEELDDLTLASHKWHQRLIEQSKFKTGEEIHKAAKALS